MIHDLRQTLRALRRAPWYSSTVIGVIAVGMALATTVFAVVDGVLFKPIELPASDRLFTVRVGFQGQAPPAGYQLVAVSSKDLQDWSAGTPGALFTGFSATRWVGFGPGVNAYDAGVVSVQPNVFDVLGVRPLIGGFEPGDFERDALMVPVIVTYPVWQGRFLGDPNILGRTVELDPVTHHGFRIVGVMPRGFVFPSENTDVKFIRPFDQPSLPASDPTYRRIFEVIARAPAGIGTKELRTRIETAMTVTAAAFPAVGPKPASASDAGWRRRGPVRSRRHPAAFGHPRQPFAPALQRRVHGGRCPGRDRCAERVWPYGGTNARSRTRARRRGVPLARRMRLSPGLSSSKHWP